jgi:hypothetical protein
MVKENRDWSALWTAHGCGGVVKKDSLMHSFHINNGSNLARLWTVLLVFGLITFATRGPLPHFHDSPQNRHLSSAVLADQDAPEDVDATNHPARIPFVAPDGQFPDLIEKFVSAPVLTATLQIPAEVPFILPARLVYTQLTSSAL